MAIVLVLLLADRARRRRGLIVKRAPALAIYAVGAFVFLHAAAADPIVFSFNSSRFTVWEGFSLRWYRAALHDPQLGRGRRRTA